MTGFGAITSRVYALFTRDPRPTRVVVDLAELTAGDRVLDVGCGAGAGVRRAAARVGEGSVAAVDPSPTFVSMVRRRVPGADVRLGGAEDVPFEEGAFTVIVSIASLHHWDDRDRGLATLVRTLAPGGRMLIAERSLASPGHGITPAGTADVMAALTGLGQTGVHAVERPVGRRRITIIVSRRPDLDSGRRGLLP